MGGKFIAFAANEFTVIGNGAVVSNFVKSRVRVKIVSPGFFIISVFLGPVGAF